jgi:3-dehydroquinate dehydratase-2
MAKTIYILNGPNLNLVGLREPGIYGHHSIAAYMETLRSKYPDIELVEQQSNVEGELVNLIQAMAGKADGLIINAGAYTHTSIAIADALRAVQLPRVIEVHISNVYAREDYRKQSFIAEVCEGSISGLGLMGYELALIALLK